jgi:hypothetical protein
MIRTQSTPDIHKMDIVWPFPRQTYAVPLEEHMV